MLRRNKKREDTPKGARNLVILGLAATLVALATTSVALAIYHNSGDIYLDRSRPGYLPDEEEIEQKEPPKEEYDFSTNTKLTNAEIDEFLTKMQEEIDAISAYEKPFGEDALSDEFLGITPPKITPEETPTEE